MDDKTPIHLFKPLGLKTLYLLILKRGTFIFVLLLILIGLFLSSRFIPYQYTAILANVILTIVVILIVSIIIIFYLGWLEYKHYGISIEEKSFTVSTGMFSEKEVGVSYRFVQEVRIERSIPDQVFGVSNIVVLVLGEAQGMPFSEISKINMPYITKSTADEIQDHILNRADAVKVVDK